MKIYIYLEPEVSKQNTKHSEKGISNRGCLISTADVMLYMFYYSLYSCPCKTCLPQTVKIENIFTQC